MKKLYFTFLIFILINLNAFAQRVNFSSQISDSGISFKFTYNPDGTVLQNTDGISCDVFLFSGSKYPKSKKVVLFKQGTIYNGELFFDKNVSLVGLSFSSGLLKDEPVNGYLLAPGKDGKENAMGYLNYAWLFEILGRRYLGMKPDLSKSVGYYKKAFELNPSLKSIHLVDYLTTAYKANNTAGNNLINAEISRLKKNDSQQEEVLETILKLYNIQKKVRQADSLKTVLIKRYPLGETAYNTTLNNLIDTTTVLVLDQNAQKIIADFKLLEDTAINKSRLRSLYMYLIYRFSKSDEKERFMYYAAKEESKFGRASWLNSYASKLAAENVHIEFALDISKQSLDLVDLARRECLPEKFLSEEEYDRVLDDSYGSYADTYASLLDRNGQFKMAVQYQDTAIKYSPSAEVASRYVTYLIHDNQTDRAFKIAEKLIANGQTSDPLQKDFKNLFMALKKEGSFDDYQSNLLSSGSEKERNDWRKRMINIPAPEFSLMNLMGEMVTLSDFKGKIIILDYWATWCEPCIASFPGMQQALNNYQNRSDVVFLFINTKQNEVNREEVVKKFIQLKKYKFNILFDTKNKNDESQFDIATAYHVNGIPTKIVIDKAGNIRFKIIGSTSDVQSIVKEMGMMINLTEAN